MPGDDNAGVTFTMKATRYSTSRQKACQQCSSAKARCDHKPGSCSRCAQRGFACTYPRTAPPRRPDHQATEINNEASISGMLSASNMLAASDDLSPNPEPDELSSHSPRFSLTGWSPADISPGPVTRNKSSASPTSNAAARIERDLDFTSLDLMCPINVDNIASRWVNSYIPVPGQVAKDYPPRISDFIYRILKSYTGSAVRGHSIPSLIHPSQMIVPCPPLATCMSIIRMYENPLPGSENTTFEVIQQEMSKIYERQDSYNDMDLLATFQAYLIYTMVLFFRGNQGLDSIFLRRAMMNLQEVACSTSRRGLMCLAEQQRLRPKWEAWIVTEVKRRTLFVMYLFDNVLSRQEGLPSFLGNELQGLSAPASKSLWEAKARRDWEVKYNIHLAEWPDGGLRIDELWAIPPELNEDDIAERRGRVDKWLEDLDEFGVMIYAVTSCTHGG